MNEVLEAMMIWIHYGKLIKLVVCNGYIAYILVMCVASITQKIHQKLSVSHAESTNVFPLLPGSHLLLTNPALEFIKAVCEVLYYKRE